MEDWDPNKKDPNEEFLKEAREYIKELRKPPPEPSVATPPLPMPFVAYGPQDFEKVAARAKRSLAKALEIIAGLSREYGEMRDLDVFIKALFHEFMQARHPEDLQSAPIMPEPRPQPLEPTS